jgi:hypothetical protein
VCKEKESWKTRAVGGYLEGGTRAADEKRSKLDAPSRELKKALSANKINQ